MKQWLLLTIGILVWFSGCGPRYVIKNQYIPPATNNAVCLNRCSSMRQACQDQCQRQYQYCLDDAYMKAKAVEIDEVRAYDFAYSRYVMDMSHFRMHMHAWERDYNELSRDLSHYQSQCERDKDARACKQRDALRNRLSHLKHSRPMEPLMPMRPSFEQILVHQQSFCTNDCGCDQTYDNCFVGCGGVVIPHKICVDNCD
jgi:hypothetical protein